LAEYLAGRNSYDKSKFFAALFVAGCVAQPFVIFRWSYVTPMNVTRSRVALVADMDKLWAIGGYDGMKNLSTVRTLDYTVY
jgi:hypothetical protein